MHPGSEAAAPNVRHVGGWAYGCSQWLVQDSTPLEPSAGVAVVTETDAISITIARAQQITRQRGVEDRIVHHYMWYVHNYTFAGVCMIVRGECCDTIATAAPTFIVAGATEARFCLLVTVISLASLQYRSDTDNLM